MEQTQKRKATTAKHTKKQKKLIIDQFKEEELEDILKSDSDLSPKQLVQNQKKQAKTKAAPWFDPNDADIMVNISDTARLRKLRKNDEELEIAGDIFQERLHDFYKSKLKYQNFYNWADQVPGQQQDDVEDQLFLDKLLKSQIEYYKGDQLIPETVLDISRCAQVKMADKHDSVIQYIDFHANSQLFLTCGLDKMVKLYNVRQDSPLVDCRNKIKMVKQIYLEGLPIKCSKFLSNSDEIISTGLKKHLLCYNLNKDKVEKISNMNLTCNFTKKIDQLVLSSCGQYFALFNDEGYIVVASAKTKQFLFDLRMNDDCRAVCFSSDSKYIFSVNQQGKIYQWDLKNRKIFDVCMDEGSFQTTCINSSADGNYLATGSAMGVVNVYRVDKSTNKINKDPIKEIQNLTTSIGSVEFNQQSEVLMINSKWKKNSIRLVNSQNFQVYQNWPNFKTNLKFITACTFSQNCQYMALGNDAGNVHLYNLKHYNQ